MFITARNEDGQTNIKISNSVGDTNRTDWRQKMHALTASNISNDGLKGRVVRGQILFRTTRHRNLGSHNH